MDYSLDLSWRAGCILRTYDLTTRQPDTSQRALQCKYPAIRPLPASPSPVVWYYDLTNNSRYKQYKCLPWESNSASSGEHKPDPSRRKTPLKQHQSSTKIIHAVTDESIKLSCYCKPARVRILRYVTRNQSSRAAQLLHLIRSAAAGGNQNIL